jgi:hypothetical protein
MITISVTRIAKGKNLWKKQTNVLKNKMKAPFRPAIDGHKHSNIQTSKHSNIDES